MGESDLDLFQDRTPRPSLNSTKLFPPSHVASPITKKKEDWILHYAKCAVNRIRRDVGHSWQDTLTRNIIFEALQGMETLEDVERLRNSVSPTLF
jgi:hypothetical protein